jgi:hypothetical protein
VLQTGRQIPVPAGHERPVALFEEGAGCDPNIQLLEDLIDGEAGVDLVLGDACELRAEGGEFGVVGGPHVVVEGVQFASGGSVDDGDWEFDDFGAGGELDVVVAGGFEVEDQQVLEICLEEFGLHILLLRRSDGF